MNLLYISIGFIVLGVICIITGWLLSSPINTTSNLPIQSTDVCVNSETHLVTGENSKPCKK